MARKYFEQPKLLGSLTLSDSSHPVTFSTTGIIEPPSNGKRHSKAATNAANFWGVMSFIDRQKAACLLY